MNERCSKTTHRLKKALLAKIDDGYLFVVEVAKHNFPKVRERISGEIMHKYLDQWMDALNNKDILKALIADESDFGLDLWQISPFAGVFTSRERWAILKGETTS
jgi:hypothetical protein